MQYERFPYSIPGIDWSVFASSWRGILTRCLTNAHHSLVPWDLNETAQVSTVLQALAQATGGWFLADVRASRHTPKSGSKKGRLDAWVSWDMACMDIEAKITRRKSAEELRDPYVVSAYLEQAQEDLSSIRDPSPFQLAIVLAEPTFESTQRDPTKVFVDIARHLFSSVEADLFLPFGVGEAGPGPTLPKHLPGVVLLGRLHKSE